MIFHDFFFKKQLLKLCVCIYIYYRYECLNSCGHTHTHLCCHVVMADCGCLTSWCQNVSINNFNFMLHWRSRRVKRLINCVLPDCINKEEVCLIIMAVFLLRGSCYNQLISINNQVQVQSAKFALLPLGGSSCPLGKFNFTPQRLESKKQRGVLNPHTCP